MVDSTVRWDEKAERNRELRPKSGLMRTQSFIIRVGVCFLLSLIPATELENLIYSQRMEFRGRWGKDSGVLILEAEGQDLSNPLVFAELQKGLRAAGAAGVFHPGRFNHNDLIVDSDGIVRSSILRPKGSRPTLTAAVGRELNLTLDWIKKPREPHLINFLGPAASIPHCSVNDFFSADNPSCSNIAGKTVILNEENSTVFFTPLGEMTRAEVLANELHTVIGRNLIYRASWVERSLLSVAMVLILAFFIMYYPVMVSAAAALGIGVLVLGLGFQLIFQFFDIYVPSANIGGAMLITYLIFTGYKLSFQENLHWRSVKQAQYIRDLDRMKTNVLSLLSHDLKTPIAKIQAVAQRMKRELSLPVEERSDWKELLDSIETSNNELKHYISSILNLSKIESQKVTLNRKTNDINQVVQWVIKRIQPIAQSRGVVIEEKLAPLFSIEFDEELMRQVVTNLVDNAIKYSPQGGRVQVRSLEEEGFVRVEVEDFGPGIPDSQLPLMFRKFSRFLRPMQEQVKGTGLGLYLSKYFIELHGGTIGVKSVEGKGSVFSFTLPIQQS